MFGLLIFLPTLAFVPHYTYLFAFIYYFLKQPKMLMTGKIPAIKINYNIAIIGAIVLISCLQRVLFFDKAKDISDFFSFLLLVPITYFIAVALRKADIKIVVYLIFIECIVVYAEFLSGVNTFFYGLDKFKSFNNVSTSLLYDRACLGLSENSSIVSYKILIALLLIDYLKMNSLFNHLVRIVMLGALVLTFNRTVMVVVMVYYAISMAPILSEVIMDFLRLRIKVKRLLFITGTIFGLAALLFIVINYSSVIIGQFTRNTNTVEISGRDVIWPKFTSFISENWIFGNASYKYLVEYFGGLAHAHNSYLELIATHGIIITFLYFVLLITNITKKNYPYVLALLIYSFTQYGIFWGISLMDIVLFLFLFNKKINIENDVVINSLSPMNYTLADQKS